MANGDDDPVLNCLLEVCCLAGSDKQSAALATMIDRDCQCGIEMAKRIGDYMISRFDFAEKGTLSKFKKSIARLARA